MLGGVALFAELLAFVVMAAGIEQIEPVAVGFSGLSPIAAILALIGVGLGRNQAWVALGIGIAASGWLAMACYACLNEGGGPIFRLLEALGIIMNS